MATLYLGTHMPAWLAQTSLPLFVSRRRLWQRKSLPRAAGRWVLDSGGFSELSLRGRWGITVPQYAAEIQRYSDEIGGLDWAAPMDWMCEPGIIAKTGNSVQQHQQWTIENLLELRELGAPVVPVLQGWQLDEYLRHIDQYQAAGVELAEETIVAVGSVCRRGQDGEIVRILDRLAREGLRLHGFGVRSSALVRIADAILSADSLAWSYDARRSEPLPGHTHQTCASCLDYAQQWHQLQRQALASTRLAVV